MADAPSAHATHWVSPGRCKAAVQRLLHAQGDLNGDGEPEIIVATHEAKLRVRAGTGAAVYTAGAARLRGHRSTARSELGFMQTCCSLSMA